MLSKNCLFSLSSLVCPLKRASLSFICSQLDLFLFRTGDGLSGDADSSTESKEYDVTVESVPVNESFERDVVTYKSSTVPLGGHEAKFVNTLLKRHECRICLFAMRNPVQTKCGHRFCRGCLETVLERKRPMCPLDRGEISRDEVRKTSHIKLLFKH